MNSKELKELNRRTKENRERSAALEKERRIREEQLKCDKEFDDYCRLSIDGIFFLLGMVFTTVVVFIFC